MCKFRSFSFGTEGANHTSYGLPCQDASLNDDFLYNNNSVSVVAIADGHGSPQYFRSDIGAKIAADVALKGIKEFCGNYSDTPDSFIEGNGITLLERLAKHVISAWYTCVSDVDNSSPVSGDVKIESLDEKYRYKYRNDPDNQYFCHAYGTTLIAVAMSDNYWFGFQIGDGKCEVLYEDGGWDQPIPWDENCFLNSTTSLCDEDAIKEFRYWYGFRRTDGTYMEHRYAADNPDTDNIRTLAVRPIAVFIGSDGVDDTYPIHDNETYLVYLYRSIVLSIAENGYDRTEAQILDLAKRLAEQGSRDDVSIAGIIGDIRANNDLIGILKKQSAADIAKQQTAATAEAATEVTNGIEVEAIDEDGIEVEAETTAATVTETTTETATEVSAESATETTTENVVATE